MSYEEQFFTSPISGQETEGVSDDVLPLPQFRKLENFVYEKEGEVSLRRNLTLLTNFFQDNPIQLFAYKNQLLVIGEKSIYRYDETQQEFSKIFNKENIKINLDLISQKERDILYPSIFFIGDICYIFYFSDKRILYKKFDVREKQVNQAEDVLESNIEISGISSGSYNNNLYYSYSTENQLFVKQIEGENNSIRQFTANNPIVDHKIVGNRVYYNTEDNTSHILNEVFTGSSTTHVEDLTFRDNFSEVQTLGGGFKLFDFRIWSEFILDGNEYQLIWTPEIGMFIINNKGIIIAKFNSNFVPLVFEDKMKFIGDPKTVNLNDGRRDIVYIPVLQAGQDEFGTGEDSRTVVRPLNIALLSIWISNDTVETGIANDQMLIAGEQLTYYDGERIVEQGFAERPKINITSNPNSFIRNTIDIPITTDTETVEEKSIKYTQRKEIGFYYNSNTFRIMVNESGDIVGYRQSLGSLISGETLLSLFDQSSNLETKTNIMVTDIFYDSINRYLAVQLSENAKVGGLSIKRVTSDNSAVTGCFIFHEKISLNNKDTFVFYTDTSLFANNTEYDIRIIPIEKYNSSTQIGEFNEQIELTNANYIDVLDYENRVDSNEFLNSTFDLRELDFINNKRRIGIGNVFINETDTQNIDLLKFRSIEAGDENTNIRTSNYGTGQGSILQGIPTNDYFSGISSFSARFEKPRIDLNNDGTTEAIPDLTVRTSPFNENSGVGNVFGPNVYTQGGSKINPIPTNNFFRDIISISFLQKEEIETTPTFQEDGLILTDVEQYTSGDNYRFFIQHGVVQYGATRGQVTSDVFSNNNILILSDNDDIEDYSGNVIELFEFEIDLLNSSSINFDKLSYPLLLHLTINSNDANNYNFIERSSAIVLERARNLGDWRTVSRGFRRQLRILPGNPYEFDYKIRRVGSTHRLPESIGTGFREFFYNGFILGRLRDGHIDSVNFNFSEPGWLQTNIPSISVTNNFEIFSVKFFTTESYNDVDTFLDKFAPRGEIVFIFAEHNDPNIISKSFTFSLDRNSINNSDPNGPKVTYSNQEVTFSIKTPNSSSIGQFLSTYSNRRVQILSLNMKTKNLDGNIVDIFPGREANTMLPPNVVDNFKPNNIDLSIILNTSSSYNNLTEFYNDINSNGSSNPPEIFLNDINLNFLNSWRNYSVSGNTVKFEYTVPGSQLNNNINVQNSFIDLLNSGPDFILNINNNEGSIFSTSMSDNMKIQKVIPGLSGVQIGGIDVDSLILSTYLINRENRLEDVELTLRVPSSSANTVFDNLSIETLKIAQSRSGSRREISLNTSSNVFDLMENFTISDRPGFRFQRYKWTSKSENGTDSLDFFDYRSGFTDVIIESSSVVGQNPIVTKSLFQVDFTGTNISQEDINPAFIIRQGIDLVPLSLTYFASTDSKAFLRTAGNINNVPYPFRQSNNIDLDIVFYVVTTESVETGEVQTVDNLADRRAYIYSAVFKWIDARGFEHRSTQSLQKDVLTSQDISEDNPIGLTIKHLNLTTRDGVKIDLYRTKKNTVVLRKVAEIINKKEFFVTPFIDTVEDNDLGEVILSDNFHPDGCDSIEVFNDRFYLAGFQNFKNKIQYSDLLNFGGSFAIKFTEENSILAEEDVVALRKMDNRIFIFTNKAIYSWPPSNSIGAPDLISGSINVSSVNKDAIQRSPLGLIFQSELGFYLLDRGLNFGFIGDPVKDLSRKEIVISSSINKSNQEILFFTNKNSTILFNYFYKKWTTFSDQIKHSIIHKNILHTLDNRGNIWIETREPKKVYTGTMETGWLQLSSIKNYQKIKSFFLVGRFKNLRNLCVYIYYDYSDFIRQVIPVNFEQISFPIPNFEVGVARKGYGLKGFPYGQADSDDIRQFRFMLKRQKCSSIKLRICVEAEQASLSAFRFQLRLLPGSGRVPPKEQFSGKGA